MSDLAWTPAELAEQLGVEIRIIRRLTQQGRIPHVRLTSQRIVYPKRQIDQWLATEAGGSYNEGTENA